jgi:methyltransferase
MSLCRWLVLLVLAQRLAEVAWGRHNERRLLAAGGIEIGASHYPLFFLLHGGWLLALWFRVPPDAPVNWIFIALFGVLQAGRLWVILSLGRFWTTRVITLPGAPLIRRGPYRWLKHPNYIIVSAEIAALPLAFGAYGLALVFSLLNLLLLRHRIGVENAALTARRVLSGQTS